VRSAWWRWLQWGGGVLVVGFVVYYLARNWDAVREAHIVWAFRPGWIAASLAVVLATYAIQVESWRRMLAGWGPRLGWKDSARVWVLSSMGKYLPGKVWAIAGMAMLAQRRGVPAWAATASAILLQAVSIATGAAIVGLTGIAALEATHPGSRAALLVVLLVSIAGLGAVLWPPVARRLVSLVAPGSAEPATPSGAAILFGVGANAVAWVTYGVALWLLARGVLPQAGIHLVESIGAFAASYIAGLLFLLAPGGFGVRESVFVLMLQNRIGLANALALAAVSRLGMTVADALAALPFLHTLREGVRDPA
jgi:uncharacterized membrane protein YbhN (UPF0104 family)